MSGRDSPDCRVLQFPIMPKKRDFTPTNRIRDRRQAAGLTLTALAQRLETTAAQVQRLEIGDRELTLHWMQRIARALDCSPADLLLPQDGGLTETERDLVDIVRDAPDSGRAAIYGVAESQRAFRHGEADSRLVPLRRA